MKAKERWDKVAALANDALMDESLRKTLQEASPEEKIRLLEERGFSEEDRKHLKKDLQKLAPEMAARVIFWL